MISLQTTHFGSITVPKDRVLSFPNGVLGFSELRSFVLIKHQDDDLFYWLVAVDAAHIAFPVIPERCFKGPRPDGVLALLIVTVPNDPTLMTANLKAPILIGRESREGLQFIEQDSSLAIRHPCFETLKRAVKEQALVELWRPYSSITVEVGL